MFRRKKEEGRRKKEEGLSYLGEKSDVKKEEAKKRGSQIRQRLLY